MSLKLLNATLPQLEAYLEMQYNAITLYESQSIYNELVGGDTESTHHAIRDSQQLIEYIKKQINKVRVAQAKALRQRIDPRHKMSRW